MTAKAGLGQPDPDTSGPHIALIAESDLALFEHLRERVEVPSARVLGTPSAASARLLRLANLGRRAGVRCHRLCHLQMSLLGGRGSGGGPVRSRHSRSLISGGLTFPMTHNCPYDIRSCPLRWCRSSGSEWPAAATATSLAAAGH
jgi:hypothetical protein